MLYFDLLKRSRFLMWLPKIIHLKSSKKMLSSIFGSTIRGLKGKKNGNSWALEKAMRSEMIKKFKETESSLKVNIMNNINRTLAIQNDADELVSKKALLHLKHCELRPYVTSIYAPSIVFKKVYRYALCTTV